MEREIKFRAWSKIKKTWENKLCLYLDDSKIGDVSDCFHNFENKEDYILDQYVGFQDKDGKDIYERDIVHVIHRGALLEGEFVEVRWDVTGWSVAPHLTPYSTLKVVGNVHEGGLERLKF